MKSMINFFFLFIQCIFTTAQNLSATAVKFCAVPEVFLPVQSGFNVGFTFSDNFMFSAFLNSKSSIVCYSGRENKFCFSAFFKNIPGSPDSFNADIKIASLPSHINTYA